MSYPDLGEENIRLYHVVYCTVLYSPLIENQSHFYPNVLVVRLSFFLTNVNKDLITFHTGHISRVDLKSYLLI